MKLNPEKLEVWGYCTVEIAPSELRPLSTAPPML